MAHLVSSRVVIVGVALFACLGGSACSSGGSTDATGSGGSTGTTGSTGAGGAGATATSTAAGTSGSTGAGGSAACTPLVNIGSVINKDHDPGPPPAMTGGAIVDGTYVLTKMVQYNGENGNLTHQETLELTGGNGRLVGSDGGGPEQAIFFSYTTAGNQITLKLTCGGTQTVMLAYTATATEFTTVNVSDANEVHTSTKK